MLIEQSIWSICSADESTGDIVAVGKIILRQDLYDDSKKKIKT